MATAVFQSLPAVSSPLATPSSTPSSVSRPRPNRNGSFPPSRPLRPFPSRKSSLQTSIKLIEPPKNHKQTFVLNLTQAELGRQC